MALLNSCFATDSVRCSQSFIDRISLYFKCLVAVNSEW